MPTAVGIDARAIWKLQQAGYAVTTHPGHGYSVTTAAGHAIVTPTSLDEPRTLANHFYELVWVGYRRVETA